MTLTPVAPRPGVSVGNASLDTARRAWRWRRARRRGIATLLTLAGPVLVVVVWELLARSGTIDIRFWPAPSSLLPTAADLWRHGDLRDDIRLTLLRVAGGFLIGSVPAVILGLAMGIWWPVRLVASPLTTVIYALPKIAMLPLVIILFGIGETSKLAIVALSIFALVAFNTMDGVRSIDPALRDVARNLGATRIQLMLTVALPGALPGIFTGLRLGLGFALVVIVGTEFLSARQGGLGDLIWQSWQILAIKKMFVGLVVVGLLGWLLTLLLELVERIAIPWSKDRS